MATLGAVGWATSATAQVNVNPLETCTIQVLNQSVKLNADGTWELPNVPSNGGQVRVRLHCTDGILARSGQSEFIVIAPGKMNAIRPIEFAGEKPAPNRVMVKAAKVQLTVVGQTSALVVTGIYPDGSVKNLSSGASGTTYVSTNAAVATVSKNGLVTAKKSGTVVISAWHDGVTVATWIEVKVGKDSDSDGLPDDWELEMGLDPNDPVDAKADTDADNLSNKAEFDAGTKPFVADTDGDGIGDGEETTAGADGFLTNPLLTDTDGDMIPDAVETQVGTDPTNPKSYDFDKSLTGLTSRPKSIVLVFNPVIGEASVQLEITGTLINGTGVNLTAHKDVGYQTLDPSVASFGKKPGQVFAGQPGTTTVRVKLAGLKLDIPAKVRSFSPKPLAFLPLPDCYGNGVALAKGAAWVACGQGKLLGVSLNPATAPALLSTLPLAGPGNDVAWDGQYVLVAQGDAGLAVIDAPSGAKPVLLGTLDTPGAAWAVEVEGTLAAIADGDSGLRFVSLVEPKTPVALGSAAVTGFVRDVALSGELAAVVTNDNTVALVSAKTPAAPIVLGSVKPGGQTTAVAMSGTWVYVAAYNGGLTVIDASDPTKPVAAATAGTSNFMLSDVSVAGSLLFGADFYRVNSVPIIQVTLPKQPIFAGVVEFSQFNDANGVTLDTDERYVAMVGELGGLASGKGTKGTTDLFLGQYDDLQDPYGIPPTCVITQPGPASVQTSGAKLTVKVAALDDVFLEQVRFYIDDTPVGTDDVGPYLHKLKLPEDLAAHALRAEAIDVGGNVGVCDSVVVTLKPDPLTTVVGRVVDNATPPNPVADAEIQLIDQGLTVMAGADGKFTLIGAHTGDELVLTAVGTVGTLVLGDTFGPFAPQVGGTTDVGDLVLVTTLGAKVGASLVARPVTFYTSKTGDDLGFVMGPVVSRPVTFFVPPNDDVGLRMGHLVSRPVTFIVNPSGGSEGGYVTGPIVARPVTFTAADDLLLAGGILGGPVLASPLTFSIGPRLTSVLPTSVSATTGPFTLTLTGVGLDDVDSFEAWFSGAANAGLTATITGGTDTTLTVNLTMSAATPKGKWTLVPLSVEGAGVSFEGDDNTFTVK